MTIEVETGLGSTTAESYASVSDADVYLSLRGISIWSTISAEKKEQALRRATDYMTATYRLMWQGIKVSRDQALDWPRYDVEVDGYTLDSNVLPKPIKNACIELALKAAAGELVSDLEQGVVTEEIGPIKFVYDTKSNRSKQYVGIDRMLRPFLSSSGSSIRLVRT